LISYFECIQRLEGEEGCEMTFGALVGMIKSGVVPSRLQHQLIRHRQKQRTRTLMGKVAASVSPSSLVQFNSGRQPRAALWLTVEPSQAFRFTNMEFRTAFGMKFNVPLPAIATGIVCDCKSRALLDCHGHHLVKCGNERKLTYETHEAVKQVVVDLIAWSKDVIPKVRNIKSFQVLGSKRQGDIEFSSDGVDYILDVGVTSAVTAAVMGGKVTKSGEAAADYELRKNNKYRLQSEMVNKTFLPLIIENQGCLGAVFSKFLSSCITSIDKVSMFPGASTNAYWSRRLSVAVQKGTARAVNHRLAAIRTSGRPPPDNSTSPTASAGLSSGGGGGGGGGGSGDGGGGRGGSGGGGEGGGGSSLSGATAKGE